MYKLKQRTLLSAKRAVFGLVAGLVFLLAPAPYVFANGVDGTTPSASTSCSPVTPTPGTNSPTGASAQTFTYDSCTGLWENDYYTWSPVTHMTSPRYPYEYTCNPSTWRWETSVWNYSPVKNAYYPTTVSYASLPAGGIVAAGSLDPCASPPVASPNPDNTSIGGSAGPDTTNTTGGTSSYASATNSSATAVAIANGITSVASSGDANIMNNTTGGSATTGNATVIANILNAVQSQTSLSGGNVATFVANINGDVQGNLIVDPGQLQPASSSDPLSNNSLTVNSQTNGQISNDINLAAATGNATVAKNTSAGNATTGNAMAIADVVNMLDSIVSAGKSFVGVININGNLHGNILVPQSFLDSLVASNAPSTTVALSQSQANNLGITTTNSLATTNNITSSATTGAATVSHNTSAGNATTGNASTKVTVFNLTGSQIIGANCLLVFVNVSGTWVGVIMNAPAGTTAAALGSGITGNTVDNAVIDAANNNAITNNINVAATTGDATVDSNTSAGSATTGNASTAVNLLNLNNTQLDLTGWFGVLFINIFGNWYGSFGTVSPPITTSGGPKPVHHTPGTHKVFQLEPSPNVTLVSALLPATPAAPAAQRAGTVGTVLGETNSHLGTTSTKTAPASDHIQLVGGILVAIGLVVLATERMLAARARAHSSH